MKTTKMKAGLVIGLEEETGKNAVFRRVLYTGKFSQLVLMKLRPREEIGEEVHDTVDQVFRFEEGEGVVVIDGVASHSEDHVRFVEDLCATVEVGALEETLMKNG